MKARRKVAHGKMTRTYWASEGDLNKDHLRPEASVLADHFESRIKGRTFSPFGRGTPEHYDFVDHMIGYLQVEQQLDFSSTETIRTKQAYEKHCLYHGIMVDSYLTDSGVFKDNASIDNIREYA